MSADLRFWRKCGTWWDVSAHSANHRQEERAKEQDEGLKPGQKRCGCGGGVCDREYYLTL